MLRARPRLSGSPIASLSAAASAACRTEREAKHHVFTENVGEREVPLGLRGRWRRLRRQWHRRWHGEGFADSAVKFGVDAPLARSDGRFAPKPPDRPVVVRLCTSLRSGPAATRKRPHLGSEDAVNVIHALDLRQAMRLALGDAPFFAVHLPDTRRRARQMK